MPKKFPVLQLSQSDRDADWIKYVNAAHTLADRKATSSRKQLGEAEGYWITTDSGSHIFVQPGQSKGDAIRHRFGGGSKVRASKGVNASIVEQQISELPASHLSGVNQVGVYNKSDYLKEGGAKVKGSVGFFNRTTNNIGVLSEGRSENAVKSTLCHEVGHAVLSRQADTKTWNKLARKYEGNKDKMFAGARSYLKVGNRAAYRDELFADTYMHFARNGDRLKAVAPDLHAHMGKIFK